MFVRAVVVGIALLMSGCSIGAPEPATEITDTGATLNGLVLSLDPDTDVQYWFRYGETTAYGQQTPERTIHFPAEPTTFVRVSEPITGLDPWTTYHYQVCTAPPRVGCLGADRALTTGPAVVFAAERDGQLAIWRMDAGGHGQVKLTEPPPFGASKPTGSPDGGKIAFARNLTGNYAIWLMNPDGSDQHPITDGSSFAADPAWSPDGSRIAFSDNRDGNYEIYVMNADGSDVTRLTDSPGFKVEPAWSPDGTKIVFAANGGAPFEPYHLYAMDADGTDPIPLSDGTANDRSPSWSPDGATIAFFRDDLDIWVMDPDGDNIRNLTDSPDDAEEFPEYSPDGSRIAFTSSSRAPGEHNDDIWVMRADGTGRTRLTDDPGVEQTPAWLPPAAVTTAGG